MANMTFGMYFPGNSLLHKMDARMKIVLLFALMISIFICKNYFSLLTVILATVIVVAISKIKLKTILKSIKPIIFIVIFTSILNLFYGSGDVIVHIGNLKITDDGINNAIFMAFRIILLVVQSSLLTYTTSPTSLTDAIEALMKPLRLLKIDTHSIAMTMTIALRFIPTLTEELNKIMSAQKSRGADMESGGLISRAKALIPVIIPLFVSSFRRANDLADAMECRCYRGGVGRTKMNIVHLQKRDYISALVVLIYFVGIILFRVFTSNVI